MKPVFISLPGNEKMTLALAGHLGAEVGQATVRRFPDGESYVCIEAPVSARHVVLVCTLDCPDDKALPLLFAAATAKELGASRVGLVAPYLAYMRQDQRFRAGEGITSVYFARIVSSLFDWVVTVDPHLHRRSSLGEIYSVPTAVAHAASKISEWIRANVDNPVLLGPDRESAQWVAEVGKGADAPFMVLDKIRVGDRHVEVSMPDVQRWRDRTPVLVDDIISTARTMIETVGHLKRAQSRPPVCIGVHGIFAGDAYADLLAAGAARVVTCNTISHMSNGIDVSDPLAAAIRETDAASA